MSDPVGRMVVVGSRSLMFAETARLLGEAARRERWRVPSFRSPPRVLGRDRTIRRHRDGSVVVAVNLSDRPFVAVIADMVEGTVAANELEGVDADRCRRALWTAVEVQVDESMSAGLNVVAGAAPRLP